MLDILIKIKVQIKNDNDKKKNFKIYFITFIIISTHYLYFIISNKLGYNDFFFKLWIP